MRTLEEQRRVEKSLRRRWAALLKDTVAECRARGVTDPEVYIEAESGLCAMDASRVSMENRARDIHSTSRTEAIVFSLPWPRGIKCDVGAW